MSLRPRSNAEVARTGSTTESVQDMSWCTSGLFRDHILKQYGSFDDAQKSISEKGLNKELLNVAESLMQWAQRNPQVLSKPSAADTQKVFVKCKFWWYEVKNGLLKDPIIYTSTPSKSHNLPSEHWSISSVAPDEALQKQTRSDFCHPEVGMTNVGNSCYMNAALQALFSSSFFVKHILEHKSNNKCAIKFCATCAVVNIYKGVKTPHAREALYHLNNHVKGLGSMFEPGAQQDSSEFVSALLQRISVEYFGGKPDQCRGGLTSIVGDFQISYNILFGGLLGFETTCQQCLQAYTCREPYTEISVSVEAVNSVKGALDAFFATEEVMDGKNKYHCSNCSAKNKVKTWVRAVRRIEMVEAPQLLVVVIKRSSISGEIIAKSPISNEEEIDVGPYMHGEKRGSKYTLLAVINHLGTTLSSGHYTATVKTGENEFKKFDDSKVSSASVRDLLNSSESVFVLYERIPDSIKNEAQTEITAVREAPTGGLGTATDSPFTVKEPRFKGGRSFISSSESDDEQQVVKPEPKFRKQHINNRKSVTSSSSEGTSGSETDTDELWNKTKRRDFKSDGLKSFLKNREQNRSSEDSSSGSDEHRDEFAKNEDIASSKGWKTKYGQNIKRRGETMRYCAKAYTNYEFSIEIARQDWKKCLVKSSHGKYTINGEAWSSLLLDEFEKNDNQHHTVNFKSCGKVSSSKKRGITLDAYSYCRDGSCKHFVVAVEISDFKCPPLIEVYSRGKTNHPAGVLFTRQLNRERRKRVRKAVRKDPVSKYQDKQIKKLSDDAFAEGHLEGVKSDAVLYNVRSEVLAEGDMHCNDMVDILLRSMVKEKDPFIRRVANPLEVILFTKAQITSILSSFKSWRLVTVHIDATGSLVRNPPGVKGRVYVYAGVVNVISTILPLFEMVSVQHDQGAIGDVFRLFRSFCVTRLRKKWPCIGRGITDCSFATIHAFMVQFNQMNLDAYLRVCYKYLCGSYTHNDFWKLVVLQLCRNHWQKMTSMNLKSHSVKKEKRYLILEATAALLETKTLDEFQLKFKAFACLLMCKKVLPITSDAANVLVLGHRMEEDIVGVGPDPENMEELVMGSDESLMSSPFFQLCFGLLQDVKQLIKSEEKKMTSSEIQCLEENPAFCPRYLKDIFMPKCSPLIPLWTEVMSDCRGKNSYCPPSNANAEDYFKIMKDLTHKDSLHNKIGRFADKEKKYIETKLVKVDKKLITNSKAFLKYRNIDNTRPEKEVKKNQETQPLNATSCKAFNKSDPSSDTLKENRFSQGKWGKQQTENWKLHKSARKRSHFDKFNIKKTFVKSQQGAESEDTEIDDIPEKKMKLSNNECDTEIWHSPPESEKKRTKRPIAAKERSTAKSSARKLLKSLFSSVDNDDDVDSPDVIYDKTEPPLKTLERTYYGQYAIPPVATLNKLSLVGRLSPSEVQYVWNTCRGDEKRPVLIYGDLDRPLQLLNFCELLDEKSLSTATIDACAGCLEHTYDLSEICILSTAESNEIFVCNYTPGLSVCRRNLELYKKILVPYLFPGHWVLCVVDIRNETFCLLDPAGTSSEKEETLCNLFQTFLENCNMKKHLRILKETSYPLQKEDYNCGVFILYYVECLLKREVCSDFDANSYRVALAKMIISRGKEIWEESEIAVRCQKLLFSRYDNGLFKQVKYYTSDKVDLTEREEYVVSCVGEGMTNIWTSDFSKLVLNRWLTNSVIDALIHFHMTGEKRGTFLNVRCTDATNAIEGGINKNSILSNISISRKTLLMPVNINENHWCLIIADMKSKNYLFLDPLNLKNTSDKQDEFMNFLRKRNACTSDYVDCSKWKVGSSAKYPAQTDAVNCGIFVVYYILCALKIKKISKNFDAKKFRKEMAYVILQRSPTMRHLCLKCGQSEYSVREEIIGQMVQCSDCHRWVHKRCDSVLQDLQMDEIQKDDYVFQCPLCKAVKQSH